MRLNAYNAANINDFLCISNALFNLYDTMNEIYLNENRVY